MFTAKPHAGSAELSLSSVVQQQSRVWCEWAEIPPVPEPSWGKASSALPPHPLGLCPSWILQPLVIPMATSILQEPGTSWINSAGSLCPVFAACAAAPLVLQGGSQEAQTLLGRCGHSALSCFWAPWSSCVVWQPSDRVCLLCGGQDRHPGAFHPRWRCCHGPAGLLHITEHTAGPALAFQRGRERDGRAGVVTASPDPTDEGLGLYGCCCLSSAPGLVKEVLIL